MHPIPLALLVGFLAGVLVGLGWWTMSLLFLAVVLIAGAARIAWIGTMEGKRIEGHYVVESSGLNAVMNGSEKQQGIWTVSR